jgi:hypothetical protein
MPMLPTVLMVLMVVAAIAVQATTRYVVESDRIRIVRTGFTWMNIPFDDVADIHVGSGAFSIFNITMTQPAFRGKLRIRRKKGLFANVVINPREPIPLLESFARYHAAKTQPTTPA